MTAFLKSASWPNGQAAGRLLLFFFISVWVMWAETWGHRRQKTDSNRTVLLSKTTSDGTVLTVVIEDTTVPSSVPLWRLTVLPSAGRHQLSLVGWQRHGVHTLGRSGRWRRRCRESVRVHGRQRRVAEGGLRDAAAGGSVSRSSTKSVARGLPTADMRRSTTLSEPLSCPTSQAANRSGRTPCAPPPRSSSIRGATTLSLSCTSARSQSRGSTAGW